MSRYEWLPKLLNPRRNQYKPESRTSDGYPEDCREEVSCAGSQKLCLRIMIICRGCKNVKYYIMITFVNLDNRYAAFSKKDTLVPVNVPTAWIECLYYMRILCLHIVPCAACNSNKNNI